MTPRELLVLTNGVPLISPRCDSKQLLVAVASLRAQINQDQYADFKSYLLPETAYKIYQNYPGNHCDYPKTVEFELNEIDEIKAALATIIAIYPEWKTEFSLPIKYKKIASGIASSTHQLIPQHIFLGEAAFDTKIKLQETIIHEMSHVWCGILSEIYDFQIGNCPKNLVLPSGTSGKDVRGVILAALFAASAVKYYASFNAKSPCTENSVRSQYLQYYLENCLNILRSNSYISDMGQLIIEELRCFVENEFSSSSSVE